MQRYDCPIDFFQLKSKLTFNTHKFFAASIILPEYLQNALVLVMGSKEEDVPAAPVEQTRFVEDMNEAELATAVSSQ